MNRYRNVSEGRHFAGHEGGTGKSRRGRIALLCLLVAPQLLLVGCSKSADEKLKEMYEYQLRYDPKAAQDTKEIYENRKYLTDDQKEDLVKAYDRVREQRSVVKDMQDEGRAHGYIND